MSNDGLFKWRVENEPATLGSGLLEVRLRESLDHLAKWFSVEVPIVGRHRLALKMLHRWNQATEPIDLTDRRELRRLTETHRLAWETFVITLAALEDRRRRYTPFTRAKLETMLGGDLVEERRDGSARNMQFELYVAAWLRLCGLAVTDGEPDLRLLYGTEEVGIAVKRIRSVNVDQVRKRAGGAAGQIETQNLRGWIALNLDSRFALLDYGQDEDALLADFTETFDSVKGALEGTSVEPHVLGFMLFGYVQAWYPPTADRTMPQHHWGTPMRWHGLADTPEDAAFFDEFATACSEKWAARRRVIMSRDFTGPL